MKFPRFLDWLNDNNTYLKEENTAAVVVAEVAMSKTRKFNNPYQL